MIESLLISTILETNFSFSNCSNYDSNLNLFFPLFSHYTGYILFVFKFKCVQA